MAKLTIKTNLDHVSVTPPAFWTCPGHKDTKNCCKMQIPSSTARRVGFNFHITLTPPGLQSGMHVRRQNQGPGGLNADLKQRQPTTRRREPQGTLIASPRHFDDTHDLTTSPYHSSRNPQHRKRENRIAFCSFDTQVRSFKTRPSNSLQQIAKMRRSLSHSNKGASAGISALSGQPPDAAANGQLPLAWSIISTPPLVSTMYIR